MKKSIKRRKLIGAVTSLALAFTLVPSMSFASTEGDSVTSLLNSNEPAEDGDTWYIYDQADMDAFVSYVNAPRNTKGVTFEIAGTGHTYNVSSVIAAADIGSYSSTSSPYIKSGTGFQGTFDGNGNTLNLSIAESGNGIGLFGYVAPEGTVEDLNIKGTVTASDDSTRYDAIGGVAGYNGGLIDKVTSTAVVNADRSYNVGGIAGFNDNYYTEKSKGTIRNCTNSGSVDGYNKVGGMAGENSGMIAASGNTATIQGWYASKSGIGGIAGRNGNNNTAVEAGVIKNCYNTGDIKSGNSTSSGSQGRWIGGITGFQNSKSSSTNCYNTGSFQGYNNCQNIAGTNENSSGIVNCYGSEKDTDNGGTTKGSSDGATLKTKDEMKDAAFVTSLGSGWKANTGSYPLPNSDNSSVATAAAGASGVVSTAKLGGTDGYKTLAEAATAAGAGGVVQVAGKTEIGAETIHDSVTVERASGYTETMFDVKAGSDMATLTTMTIDASSGSAAKGTVFNVSTGTLRLRGGITIKNAEKAVNVAAGANVTVNKAVIDCTDNTAIATADETAETGTVTLDDFGGTSIAGKIALGSNSYIAVKSAVPCDLYVTKAATGTVAKGSGYTLKDTDFGKFKLPSSETTGTFSLDTANNLITLTK